MRNGRTCVSIGRLVGWPFRCRSIAAMGTLARPIDDARTRGPARGSRSGGSAMTDETKTTPATDPDDVVVVSGAVADEYGVLAEGAVAVQGDHALVVARFANTTAARGDLRRPADGRDRRHPPHRRRPGRQGRRQRQAPRREDDRPQHPHGPQVGHRRRCRRGGLPARHDRRRCRRARRRRRGCRQGTQPLPPARGREGARRRHHPGHLRDPGARHRARTPRPSRPRCRRPRKSRSSRSTRRPPEPSRKPPPTSRPRRRRGN